MSRSIRPLAIASLLVAALGTGAFASVWLARDDQLDDWVALKVLAENWAHDEEIRGRFLEEAQITSQLDHPGIVPVHELGVDDLYEFLAGRQALADGLANGLLPDILDKRLDDRQRDVGLEQRQAHLPQRVLDIAVGQAAFAAEVACGFGEPPCQVLEHGADSSVSLARRHCETKTTGCR